MVNENEVMLYEAKKRAGRMSAYREILIESDAFDGTAKTKVIEYEPEHLSEIFYGDIFYIGDADANPNHLGDSLKFYVDDILKSEIVGGKILGLADGSAVINIEKPIIVREGSKLKIILNYETAPAEGHKFKAIFKRMCIDEESEFALE